MLILNQTDPQPVLTDDTTLRQARGLEYLTVGWNSLEAIVAITAAILAGSSALLGFGLDSVIESASGLVLLWRLQAGELGERRERTALRLVGGSLMALGCYVAMDGGWQLYQREAPSESLTGILLAVVSLLVMPWLAWRKRQVARVMCSAALRADSTQTQLCAYLSAILLAGLVLNAWLGWWWADPIAALLMVPIIFHEGQEAWRGKTCCDC